MPSSEPATDRTHPAYSLPGSLRAGVSPYVSRASTHVADHTGDGIAP